MSVFMHWLDNWILTSLFVCGQVIKFDNSTTLIIKILAVVLDMQAKIGTLWIVPLFCTKQNILYLHMLIKLTC